MGSCHITQGTQSDSLWWPRGVGLGVREAQEEGSICIHKADPHCCTAETNMAL